MTVATSSARPRPRTRYAFRIERRRARMKIAAIGKTRRRSWDPAGAVGAAAVTGSPFGRHAEEQILKRRSRRLVARAQLVGRADRLQRGALCARDAVTQELRRL